LFKSSGLFLFLYLFFGGEKMVSQGGLTGTGVVTVPPPNAHQGLPIEVETTGNRCCIYWGDHLSMHDSPTCSIRVRNNTQAPVSLKMTAKVNNVNATLPPNSGPISAKAWFITWDKENTVLQPGGYVNATLKLLIPQCMMPEDWPFVTDVTVTGA
jgi:hypothetical protein